MNTCRVENKKSNWKGVVLIHMTTCCHMCNHTILCTSCCYSHTYTYCKAPYSHTLQTLDIPYWLLLGKSTVVPSVSLDHHASNQSQRLMGDFVGAPKMLPKPPFDRLPFFVWSNNASAVGGILSRL